MTYFADSLLAAIQLLLSLNSDVWQIITTSVFISVIASLLAAFLAVPAGVIMAVSRFPGKNSLQHLLNTLMAMPTVVIGLLLYGLLSRMGPLGEWGLLYTPTAMILAQAILILPIMMNLTITAVKGADPRLLPTLISLGANRLQQTLQIIRTVRLAIVIAIISGFGRAIGEVGAAMMLGGNIEGYTRTMTTAIALETSKGAFELALALGIVLLIIAFLLNFSLSSLDKHIR